MRNKCIAEALGAFALCFIGILAITGAGIGGAPDGTTNLASIAFAHGLTIAVMVAALGAVSGGHFNPAVTFAFVVSKKMDVKTGAAYWGSQLAGGAVAAAIIALLFSTGVVASGTPALAKSVDPTAGIVLEVVTTFFLVLVVFGTAVDKRAPKSVFPLAIGLTVALDIMAIGPLTGASMNPARSFGPALVSGAWANQLVYWIGPLIGGALAAGVYAWFVAARRQAKAEQDAVAEKAPAAAKPAVAAPVAESPAAA